VFIDFEWPWRLQVSSAVGNFSKSCTSENIPVAHIGQDVFTNKSESVGGFLHFTWGVRRNLGEMYSGDGWLSVCLSVTAFPHYCTDPDVSWGNCRGCRLVVRYLVDLQSVHGLRCCDNIAPNAKCPRVLVLTLCLVVVSVLKITGGHMLIHSEP